MHRLRKALAHLKIIIVVTTRTEETHTTDNEHNWDREVYLGRLFYLFGERSQLVILHIDSFVFFFQRSRMIDVSLSLWSFLVPPVLHDLERGQDLVLEKESSHGIVDRASTHDVK